MATCREAINTAMVGALGGLDPREGGGGEVTAAGSSP